jgi:hypothetical protein
MNRVLCCVALNDLFDKKKPIFFLLNDIESDLNKKTRFDQGIEWKFMFLQ